MDFAQILQQMESKCLLWCWGCKGMKVKKGEWWNYMGELTNTFYYNLHFAL